MTFVELRAEVRRRLREQMGTYDRADESIFWSDADIDVALNDGYEEISDATEWNEVFQTVDLLKDRPYYDARTVLRDGYLVLGPAYNTTTSQWLAPTVVTQLDRSDGRWEQRVAEPERLLTRGLFWFSYWPWKGIAVGAIKQYYRALPTPLSADADVPGFHSVFHEALIEYALFDLFAQDGENELAAGAWQEYLDLEAKMFTYYDHRAETSRVRGQMFQTEY